ncbi:hypothetical protein ACHAXS_002007, partial [Conticribra weissflogii]
MELKFAPELAQQVMEDVLWDIKHTGVYLDDNGAFSKTWEQQILLLDEILHKLE